MAVQPSNLKTPGIWDCNYGAEVGAIIFTTAIRPEDSNTSALENKLIEALGNMISFTSHLQRTIYNLGKFQTSVCLGSCFKYKNREHQLIHCTVRVQSYLLLEPEQKKDFLSHIFNHLFNTTDKIIERNEALLERHPEVVFSDEKFTLSSSVALKLALKTAKIRVCENDPHLEPFTSDRNIHPDGSTRQCKLPETCNRSEQGKPFFSRTSLLKTLPNEYRQFFTKENCCYMCGYKIGTEQGQEKWCLHVHHKNNPPNTPPSLENQARLAAIEMCLKVKRDPIKKHRSHPYFK
ncbi:GAM-1 [Aviadenovirus bubonis]|nr:GAM-1 [Owl adenovirus]